MTRCIGYPLVLLLGFFMGMGGWGVMMIDAIARTQ